MSDTPMPDDATRYRLWIDGAECDPLGNEWFPTENPYTSETWAYVARGGAADVDKAVEAADRALHEGEWPRLRPRLRGEILFRLARLIDDNVEVLAQAEIRDNGKSITEVRAQIENLRWVYQYYAGLADKIEGKTIPVDDAKMFVYTRYEPVGVVAAITPWNSPLRLLGLKLAPALAAGATMVVKPSEYTSTSTLEFMRLIAEAGVPAGVVNVVTGFGEEAGAPLASHPKVAKISLTGGVEAGMRAYDAAAKGIKSLTLELGGKSANIIFADADLDRAIPGAASGIFGSTGQTCVAGSRLLVHEDVCDQVTEGVRVLAEKRRLGNPLDPATEMGPAANRAQFDKIMSYVDHGKEDGARLVTGGKRASGPDLDRGLFIEPTVFADVTRTMRIAREEIFGPVLSIIPFSSDQEAVEIANEVDFGLASAVWTRDLPRAHRIAHQIRAGSVWVNGYRQNDPMVPVGGYKMSGLGRESGADMIKQYLEEKAVWINY